MEKIIVCVGRGLRANGRTSRINENIIDHASKVSLSQEKPAFLRKMMENKIILQGGYENSKRITEAESMLAYVKEKYPPLEEWCFLERVSYRTHNNAIEGLKGISRRFPNVDTIVLVGHPLHIKRVSLCYQMVNRLLYKNRYTILESPAEETYDAEIPGQEYWATRESFLTREKNIMLLYKTLLYRPWAGIGLWLLRTIWPSHKQ